MVMFLVLGAVAFRGHDETDDSLNAGNFKRLAEEWRVHSPALDEHMAVSYDVTYMSHHSLKEFTIAWARMVSALIKKDMNPYMPFFTILADW